MPVFSKTASLPNRSIRDPSATRKLPFHLQWLALLGTCFAPNWEPIPTPGERVRAGPVPDTGVKATHLYFPRLNLI